MRVNMPGHLSLPQCVYAARCGVMPTPTGLTQGRTHSPLFRGWDLQVIAAAELTDAKAWYLLTDPARGATFDIAYLRGERAPIVERDNAPFNYRGLAFRCFFDYGIAALDFRGAIYAAGQ